MPRPRKCRKVCCLPNNDGFVPVRGGEELTPIVLNVDEYEAIRLIDREGFSQEQCGEYMHIARTTVQQIYAAARKKLADAPEPAYFVNRGTFADRLPFTLRGVKASEQSFSLE